MSNLSPEEAEESNPWSAHNLAVANFILNTRIYDVLMQLLAVQNPDASTRLLEMHAEGHLMSPQPTFSGVFVSDEINDEQAVKRDDEISVPDDSTGESVQNQ